MPVARTAGFVLAGGRSSRMGRDKAQLPWHGGTLIDYVVRQVEAVTETIATVGGDPIPGVKYLPDSFPHLGPVGAIATALVASDAEWNVITACDMPGVTSNFLGTLLRAADRDAVIPVTRDGRIHPLCAVYRRSVEVAMRRAVETGTRRLTDVIATVQH